MSRLAPQWALSAQAIDAAGNADLAAGVHLRIFTGAALGLPIAPFLVYRAVLSDDSEAKTARGDVLWFDSGGKPLSPPFNVTLDEPAIGLLPEAEFGVCCWISVDAAPLPPPSDVRPAASARRFGKRAFLVDDDLLRARRRVHVARLSAGAPSVRVDALASFLGVRGVGLGGFTVVASDTQSPYQLGASRIAAVLVSGHGRVDGARWIDVREQLAHGNLSVWRALALPCPTGPRYASAPDAEGEARRRVTRGTPRRFGPYERSDGPPGPGPTPTQEQARIDEHAPDVKRWLHALINDLSAPQGELSEQPTVRDETGRAVGPGGPNDIGKVTIPILGSLLQTALDPGAARFLGLSDVDTSPPASPGDVLLYIVRGLWQLQPGMSPALIATVSNQDIALPAWAEHAPDLSSIGVPPDQQVDLWTVAAVTAGRAHDRPDPPLLGMPQAGPWLPAVPPNGEREIVVPLHGLVPGAQLAFDRSVGSSRVVLNPRNRDGRASALGVGMLSTDPRPDHAELADRRAPPASCVYRVAQADWFGRWSEWAAVGAAAKERPLPEPPVLNVLRLKPALDRFEVRVAVPRLRTLPPGSLLLRSLQVSMRLRIPRPDGGVDHPAERDDCEARTPLPDILASPRPLPPLQAIERWADSLVRPATEPPWPPAIWPLEDLVVERVTTTGRSALRADGRLEVTIAPDQTGRVQILRVEVVLVLPTPSLPPAAVAAVEFEGAWLDSDGRRSRESHPLLLDLFDTRPPQPLDMDGGLRYASRPDATGRSRVDLVWNADSTRRRFRVFYTDESRLALKIEAPSDRAEEQPRAKPVPPPQARNPLNDSELEELKSQPLDLRAQSIVELGARFGRWAFEQLTGDPIEAPADGLVRFSHSISGSLDGLAVYRIVAVSAANVEADFILCPLVAVAVPNAPAPARPLLNASTDKERDGWLKLEVRVPQGLTRAAECRLRRSVLDGSDALRMPVASSAVIEAPLRDGFQTISMEQGLADGLRPWTTYYWRVEVRGSALPGAGPDGPAPVWSEPSQPVSAALIPPTRPPPASGLSTRREGPQVLVSWILPEGLSRGSMGVYRLRIYRRLAGRREEQVYEVDADASDAVRFRDADPTLPSGTTYRVVVVDPIGRVSDAVLTTLP